MLRRAVSRVVSRAIRCRFAATDAHDAPAASSRFGLLGVCEDRRSSFLRGPAAAPDLLRAALRSDSANSYCELGLDVLGTPEAPLLHDAGNLHEPTGAEVDAALAPLLQAGLIPVVLGGDHSVSFPAFAALARFRHAQQQQQQQQQQQRRPLCILHFDAHTDLYHDFEGDPLSHASPFARIMECGRGGGGGGDDDDDGDGVLLCDRLLQVGLRTVTPHHREQMARFDVRAMEARAFDSGAMAQPPPADAASSFLAEHLPRDADVYVSFDLDALDPAFAPGVSHHEPGGLSTRQALAVLHALASGGGGGGGWRLVGCDLVELNPTRDVNGVTAMVGAKVLKEMLGVAMVLNAEEPEPV